uniref:Uncharacterized protein n=1 Tax=Acrobeloides nanus TaxID=290746 RepID=A0A914E138_9BILA
NKMSSEQPKKRPSRSARRKNKFEKKKERVANKKHEVQEKKIQEKKALLDDHLGNLINVYEHLEKRIEVESTYSGQKRIRNGETGRYLPLNEDDEEWFNEDLKELDDTDPEYTGIALPPAGILVDGIPFHHRTNTQLDSIHINRLRKHGILLKKGFFAQEEDEKIRQNWREIADTYDLPDDSAQDYFILDKVNKREERIETLRFMKQIGFYPKMCKGLLNRSANQVMARARKLLVYNYACSGKKGEAPWTEEEEDQLLELYKELGASWSQISRIMNRERASVFKQHEKLTKPKKKAAVEEKWSCLHQYRLYATIKDILLKHPMKVILSQKKSYEKYEADIDWAEVAIRFSLQPEECQRRWTELKTALREFSEKNELTDPREMEEKFFGTNKVGQIDSENRSLYFLVNEKLAQCVELMKEQEGITRMKDVDVEELTRRIDESKISFKTSWAKGKRVKWRARNILYHFNRWKIIESMPTDSTFQDELDLLAYILRNTPGTTELEKLKSRQLADKYFEERGWEKRKHVRLLGSEEIENPPPLIVKNEIFYTGGLKVIKSIAPSQPPDAAGPSKKKRKRKRRASSVQDVGCEPKPKLENLDIEYESPPQSSYQPTENLEHEPNEYYDLDDNFYNEEEDYKEPLSGWNPEWDNQ